MLRSDLFDYSNAYIVVKETARVRGATDNVRKNRDFALKNNAPFISCILKINGVLIENAEDLDIANANV